jgi:hypothetical protein
METLVQEIIAEYYGNPVDLKFAAIEIRALALGHAAGTLDGSREWLYVVLASAGQLSVHGETDRTNPPGLFERINAAQAKSAAEQAAFECEVAEYCRRQNRLSLYKVVIGDELRRQPSGRLGRTTRQPPHPSPSTYATAQELPVCAIL